MSTTYTENEVFASLAAWEWLNDRCVQRDVAEGPPADMVALWDRVGTPSMRYLVMGMGPALLTFYQQMVEGYGEAVFHALESYDFGFIPAVLERLDWAGEISALAGNIGPVALTEQAKLDVEFEIWRLLASNAAGREYGYPEYVAENLEEARRAFDHHEHPDDYIERVASKHRFSSLDDYTRHETARAFPNFDTYDQKDIREARFADVNAVLGGPAA